MALKGQSIRKGVDILLNGKKVEKTEDKLTNYSKPEQHEKTVALPASLIYPHLPERINTNDFNLSKNSHEHENF